MVRPTEFQRVTGRMMQRSQTRAVLTDSHFLIPAIVFLAGITLLVVMH
jgi:hypothetical protein